MKALVFALLLVSAVCSLEQKKEGKMDLDHLVKSSVKKLPLTSMVGKWYDYAASKNVAELFQRDCECLTTNFVILDKDSNKLHIANECMNRTTRAIVSVNGTLTQLNPTQTPGIFHVSFKTEEKSGASVLKKIKEQHTKKEDSKDVRKEDSQDVQKGDIQKGDNIQKGESEIVMREENFIVLQFVEDEAMLICGPSRNLIWVLSRKPNLSASTYETFVKEAKRLEFAHLQKTPICSADSAADASASASGSAGLNQPARSDSTTGRQV